MTTSDTVLEAMGGIIIAVGFGGSALGVVRGLRSRSWPRVAGEILWSSVELSRGARGSKLYAPLVRYVYTVDGREHDGERVCFGLDKFFTERGALAIVQRYPSGGLVDVYYHPDTPWKAVLRPGVNIRTWFATGLLGTLLIFVFAALVAILR